MFFLRKLSVIAALLFTCDGISQINPYQHYSIPEGLPSSEVYDVHQDKQGFIWFATDNGVVRYDGGDMELFQVNEGLVDPVVFELIEDTKNRLWFRTQSGKVAFFSNEKIHPFKYNDSLSKVCKRSFLESMFIDRKGQVWFGAALGTGVIGTDGTVKSSKIEDLELKVTSVEDALVYAHLGPTNRMKKVTLNGKSFKLQLPDTLHPHVRMCQLVWRGEYYFSSGTAIFKINEHSVQQVFSGKDQIINLSLDNQNNLWIGYHFNGVECLSSFKSRLKTEFDFLSSKSVTKVIQDKSGGYWFSTLQDGVYYVPDINVYFQRLPVTSKVNAVTTWGEKIVFGDRGGHLFAIDRRENVEQLIQLNESILSILPVSREDLWVSTSGHTHFFDRLTKPRKSLPISFGDMVLAPDRSAWGISGVRIYRINQKDLAIDKIVDIDLTNRAITMIGRSTFLYGRLGIEAFTQDYKKIKLPSFFESIKATKIVSLNDSLLLVGTLGSGFLAVNRNTWAFKQYSFKHQFIANNVYDIEKDSKTIWLATEKGVAIASTNSMISGDPIFSFFITKSKNIDNKIDHLVLTDRVLAFTEDSFYSLPKQLKSSSGPVFRIQTILVNDQPDSIVQRENLPYDKNNIQINFHFIDFRSQNIFVRSRLSEKHPWNYSQDRSIKYYSLEAGSYHLEIEYAEDNIHWNKAMEWAFTISPPWWRTWYVLSLIALTVLGLGAFYLKRRVAFVNERNSYLNLINAQQQNLIRAELDTLERERNRIAKDLHDSVGTNLTAIKMMVSNILQKHNDPKSEVVEKEFHNTIQDIKGIIHELVPAGLEKYGLSETIRNYAIKIEEGLNLKIEVNSFGPDVMDTRLSLLSFRILQELLSNTLKHAQANKVVIHINSFDDLLSILYQDNGKGFEYENVKKGSGLMNIQSRIQTANGTLKFESGNFGVSYIIDVPITTRRND